MIQFQNLHHYSLFNIYCIICISVYILFIKNNLLWKQYIITNKNVYYVSIINMLIIYIYIYIYIYIFPLLLLTTNYLSTPNQSSYLNLLLISINHHPHCIPFPHTFLIIIIIHPPLLIPACHNLINYLMKTPL